MRPRVDLTCRYTPLPNKPSAAFPDTTTIWLPAIEVILVHEQRRYRSPSLLDTGASVTLFGTQHAEALGIDWRNAPTVPIRGVGGEDMGFAADIKIVLPQINYAWPARVIFSPGSDKSPLPLLGHGGFFEHFEVRFKTGIKEFRIFLKG